jgi:hypothetical protein
LKIIPIKKKTFDRTKSELLVRNKQASTKKLVVAAAAATGGVGDTAPAVFWNSEGHAETQLSSRSVEVSPVSLLRTDYHMS